MPSPLLTETIALEVGGQEPWPNDVKLFQPYEVEQILLPDNANCLAVQAYLRMCGLPYQVEFRSNAEFMSPSGTVPFIKCGKSVIAELEPIVSFVENKGISLTSNFDGAQKNDMKAYISLINFVLGNSELYVCWVDEDTYNNVTKSRYSSVYPWPLNHIQTRSKRSSIIKHLKAVKYYNKTIEEVYQEVEQCCRSLSDRLDDKEYFFASNPSEVDALLFGHLYCINQSKLYGFLNIIDKFPCLQVHNENIQMKYFSSIYNFSLVVPNLYGVPVLINQEHQGEFKDKSEKLSHRMLLHSMKTDKDLKHQFKSKNQSMVGKLNMNERSKITKKFLRVLGMLEPKSVYGISNVDNSFLRSSMLTNFKKSDSLKSVSKSNLKTYFEEKNSDYSLHSEDNASIHSLISQLSLTENDKPQIIEYCSSEIKNDTVSISNDSKSNNEIVNMAVDGSLIELDKKLQVNTIEFEEKTVVIEACLSNMSLENHCCTLDKKQNIDYDFVINKKSSIDICFKQASDVGDKLTSENHNSFELCEVLNKENNLMQLFDSIYKNYINYNLSSNEFHLSAGGKLLPNNSQKPLHNTNYEDTENHDKNSIEMKKVIKFTTIPNVDPLLKQSKQISIILEPNSFRIKNPVQHIIPSDLAAWGAYNRQKDTKWSNYEKVSITFSHCFNLTQFENNDGTNENCNLNQNIESQESSQEKCSILNFFEEGAISEKDSYQSNNTEKELKVITYDMSDITEFYYGRNSKSSDELERLIKHIVQPNVEFSLGSVGSTHSIFSWDRKIIQLDDSINYTKVRLPEKSTQLLNTPEKIIKTQKKIMEDLDILIQCFKDDIDEPNLEVTSNIDLLEKFSGTLENKQSRMFCPETPCLELNKRNVELSNQIIQNLKYIVEVVKHLSDKIQIQSTSNEQD